MTQGQINLWRLDVKRATLRAHYDMVPMSTIPAYNRWWNMSTLPEYNRNKR